jgi:Cu(I)/Ag(I) efflux system membrane fusion protein
MVRAGEEVVRGNLELPSLLVDPASNVVHGRIEIPFTGGIRPGAAVAVTLSCRNRRALAVPSSAVIRRAGRDYVMRWEGDGRFRPVEVGVGVRSREFVEITRGLKAGDQAAAAGEFLIEAESSFSQTPAEPL